MQTRPRPYGCRRSAAARPIRDALTTLRANLTIESETFRHALRVAATVAVACACYRLLHLPRGYWIPMTAVLVLRPEFTDTFARGAGADRRHHPRRRRGHADRARCTTPGPVALTLLVLIFVWGCYALFRMNYVLFADLPDRLRRVHPDARRGRGDDRGQRPRDLHRRRRSARGRRLRGVADMGREHGAVGAGGDAGYPRPLRVGAARRLRRSVGPDRKVSALRQLRSEARLARSNAEATIERMLSEPASRATIAPRVGDRPAGGAAAACARGALAARRPGAWRAAADARHALAAGAADGESAGDRGAVRSGSVPDALPPLRQTQLALAPSADALVGQETDLMVDSVKTMAELLAWDAARAPVEAGRQRDGLALPPRPGVTAGWPPADPDAGGRARPRATRSAGRPAGARHGLRRGRSRR